MKIFEKAKDLTEEETKVYYKEHAKRNSYYMIIISIALAVVETLILVYGFVMGYHKANVTIALLCFYSLIIITALVILSITVKLRKNIDKNYKKIMVLSVIYAFIILFLGDVITNLDNLHFPNSNNIIVCLIVILGFSTIVHL